MIPGWWVRLSDGERCYVYDGKLGYVCYARYYFRDGGTMGFYPVYSDLMQTHEPEDWR